MLVFHLFKTHSVGVWLPTLPSDEDIILRFYPIRSGCFFLYYVVKVANVSLFLFRIGVHFLCAESSFIFVAYIAIFLFTILEAFNVKTPGKTMAIRAQGGNLLEFEEGSISEYSGTLVGCAWTVHSVTREFSVLMQVMQSELYTIQYNWFKFRENFSLSSETNKHGLFIRAAIKGSIAHEIITSEPVYLRQDNLLALWANRPNCTTHFEAGSEYSTFDLYASPALASEMNALFPEFSSLITSEEIRQLCKQPCFLSQGMRDVIRQILECPYDAATSHFFVDIKVKEFLFLLLHEIYKKTASPSPFSLSEPDVARVLEARDILLRDLRKTHTIAELSRAVGINTFKLKIGFREVFNTGVFECLQDNRLEHARELIVQTDKPLKEIGMMCGYPRITNFITAFRKKFGYTPGSLRR